MIAKSFVHQRPSCLGRKDVIVNIDHHLLQRFAERWENDVQIIKNNGDTGPVYRKEIVEVSEKPAGGLDLSEDRRDVVVELEAYKIADAQKMRRDLVRTLCFPPAAQQLLHTHSADINIKSMRLWLKH